MLVANRVTLVLDNKPSGNFVKQQSEAIRKFYKQIDDRKLALGDTRILTPKPSGKRANAYKRQKAKKRFRRRAGIEAIIGHLKSDYRMMRNFMKGSAGDSINLMLAAAAFNFKKWMREVQDIFVAIFIACLATNIKRKVTC